jgi:putative SOS response-associated peptidase YedK
MCGRYALDASAQDLIDYFGLARGVDFPVRFNIAPSSSVPVIRQNPGGERMAGLLKWGLVPHWAKDASIGNRLANARAETLGEKASFRTAWQRRRCLVPATGFYEWHTEGRVKLPYYIHRKDGQLLALGGLWESWMSPEGTLLRTFCLITTTPNRVMAPIHDRMPVIIGPEDHAAWLDPQMPGQELSKLLAPYPAEAIEAWPVDRRVSSARVEGAELIEPLTPA